MSSKSNPLPLSDTLRDLAVLRALEIDLSSVLPKAAADEQKTGQGSEHDGAVDRSYEFAQNARAAIKLMNRGDVDKQGERLEDVRSRLEDVSSGLEGHEEGQ